MDQAIAEVVDHQAEAYNSSGIAGEPGLHFDATADTYYIRGTATLIYWLRKSSTNAYYIRTRAMDFEEQEDYPFP